METKNLTINQYRAAVNIAKAIDPQRTKRDSLLAKIALLQEECDSYTRMMANLEAGFVKEVGVSVEDLVKKVIEPGVDANGNPKKTTKYVLTDNVQYDKDKRVYVVTINSDAAAPQEKKLPEDEVYDEAEEEAPAFTDTDDAPDSDNEDNAPAGSSDWD